jgi:hypothetical protein
MKHPMQPIFLDQFGVARFKANAIICWLFETGRMDLNQIAVMGFGDEDRMQIAQLLGYSVSGYGDLSYVSPESLEEADIKAAMLIPPDVDEPA